MTETGGGAITSPRSAREYVSVGVPVPTVEIKVCSLRYVQILTVTEEHLS